MLAEACQLPDNDITVPDSSTASEAEMLEAQAAVRAYDAGITAYTGCLADAESRLAARHAELIGALGIARADLNDSVVARAEQVVASFNEALKKYRERGITPARIRNTATKRELEFCYPKRMLRTNVNVVVSISEIGQLTDIELPPAVSAEIQAAVRCVVKKWFSIPPLTMEFQFPVLRRCRSSLA
ncbi:MAG: hypothetical protein EXR87_06585 [Gammaproteobacteria bacterium]|nr:hypothetical protein [Gammaproteobacteria bacterium]